MEQNILFTDSEISLILEVKSTIKYIVETNIPKDMYVNMVVAGGCFTSLINSEKPKDIDIYWLDAGGWAVTKFLVEHNAVRMTIPEPNYRTNTHIKSIWNVEARQPHPSFHATTSPHQHMLTDYKTRKDVLDDFDFVHTTVSYDIGKDKLYITREAYDAIKNKKLIPHRNNKPTLHRYEKFIERGWN